MPLILYIGEGKNYVNTTIDSTLEKRDQFAAILEVSNHFSWPRITKTYRIADTVANGV